MTWTNQGLVGVAEATKQGLAGVTKATNQGLDEVAESNLECSIEAIIRCYSSNITNPANH